MNEPLSYCWCCAKQICICADLPLESKIKAVFVEMVEKTGSKESVNRRIFTEILSLREENERLSALCDKWNTEGDEVREDNRRLDVENARLRDALVVAVDAMERALSDERPYIRECKAESYVLVPRKPTAAMCRAFYKASPSGFGLGHASYKAMLAAVEIGKELK